MFGFFKKDGIGSALDECQQYYKQLDLGQELTPNQLAIFKSMVLFKDIDSRHRSKGLTKYGGLAWLCAQILGNTFKAIDDGNSFSSETLEFMEKLAFVSLAIGNSIAELKLTKDDMAPIANACELAIEWINRNPHPLDSELSRLMQRYK